MPEYQTTPGPEHINEAELARRFEEKKRLLEASGAKPETKEVFREAFREHVAERKPPAPAPFPSVAPVSFPRSAAAADDQELKSLVDLALEKGVFAAIHKAEAETPYLIDALHDALVDHYFDKLVAAGKLSAT